MMQRIAALGSMAALTVALAACSGTTSPAASPSSAPAMPTPAAVAAGSGITTNADVFGPACGMLPTGDAPGSLNNMGPQPVASAASTNPLLTTLVTAVGKVPGLADTLNAQKGITVYAPTNDAFAEVQKSIGDAAFTALLSDPDKLGALLSYHVVGTRYDASSLVRAGKTTQLAGGDVTIGGTATAPTLTSGNGTTAGVLCGNIPTSNATVFVIDKVLVPKS